MPELMRGLTWPFRVVAGAGLLLGLTLNIAHAAPWSQSTGVSRLQIESSQPDGVDVAFGGMCRFGVDAGTDIVNYPVSQLQAGWYQDWAATLNPARPGGIGYLPMVRFTQTGPDAYAASPSGSALAAAVAAHPGSLWILGNEPDRKYYQDDLEPQVYAHAYHDTYYQIKRLDPAARIAAGGIVQPTPLRLQYLDLVLDSYRARYGEAMPVDVWNIHGFILRECDATLFPDCWGADIPRGVNPPDGRGMMYNIEDNANVDIFKQFIVDFRAWMAARGYQDRPLIITEFGVQMPYYDQPAFSADSVNAYMNTAFGFLATATGPTGYPADGNHLVQRWAWYSLSDDSLNGYLFDPATKTATSLGANYAAYTALVTPAANLTPIRLWADHYIYASDGSTASARLSVQVVRTGDQPALSPVTVRFYDGDPAQGGTQIGTDQTLSGLDGCGMYGTTQVTWNKPATGPHQIYAVVDTANTVAETNEADNGMSATIAAFDHHLQLPLVMTIEH